MPRFSGANLPVTLGSRGTIRLYKGIFVDFVRLVQTDFIRLNLMCVPLQGSSTTPGSCAAEVTVNGNTLQPAHSVLNPRKG